MSKFAAPDARMVSRAVARPARSLQGLWRARALVRADYRRAELSLGAMLDLPTLNDVYAYAHTYFRVRAPELIREHRRYFSQHSRGFGEDAFHAMWWLLMLERHPKRMLEVGVYRGQTLSLWALIARFTGLSVDVHGLTPLEPAGDSVSRYRTLDYAADIAANHAAFGLPTPPLTRAFSNDPAGKQLLSDGGPWDVIYLDGSHDPDVVESDYESARRGLAPGGLLVLDDASLYLPYNPPASVASGGHPGPSTIVQQRAMSELHYLGAVGHNVLFQQVISQ